MANTLVEAFKVYRKEEPTEAARVLAKAIQHYTIKGQFRRAATHQQNLAEVYELEIGDQRRALEAYETAAGWFESDNAEALANKLYLKVADLAALDGDYHKAIEKFEAVARSSVNNNLMKWSVKDYFLKAGICHMATKVRTPEAPSQSPRASPAIAPTSHHKPKSFKITYQLTITSQQDIVATRRALQTYLELDNSFQQTREFLLLNDLAEAVEQGEQEQFADKLFQFDQMSKLDKWKTTLLLRVKNNIEEQGEDFS